MVTASSKKTRRSAQPDGVGEKKKQYQVEAILDKRTRGRKVEYLLKWQGYSDADNSWQDESHLNCPDLLREFERKQMKTSKKRPPSTPSPSSRVRKLNKKTPTRRSKVSGTDETDEDYRSAEEIESQTTETPTESTLTDIGEDHDRVSTRLSQRKRFVQSNFNNHRSSNVNRRKSKRKTIDQTNSRITSMSREETSEDDDEEKADEVTVTTRQSPRRTATTSPKASNRSTEAPIILIDDDNNDSRVSQRNTNHQNGNSNDSATATTSGQRPYISASSISFGPNPSNPTNGSTTVNHNEQDVPNESHLVEKIESVRNDPNGLTFHIKLFDASEPRWISSKIANYRYPQAVIAFWESHVEFA